jgi:hypothetical protein
VIVEAGRAAVGHRATVVPIGTLARLRTAYDYPLLVEAQ